MIQSAFWHRFAATAHSPIGLNPERYGIRRLGPVFGGFAENDLIYADIKGMLPDWVGQARGLPLCRLLAIDPGQTPSSSFTISIDDPSLASHFHPVGNPPPPRPRSR